MEIGSAANLLEELQQLQVLEAPQLEEVRRALNGKSSEPRALAGHLVKKGWLTPFQVNQLFQGRGEDLILGSYLLLERQGEGGMGQVYKARHRRMRRTVSLVVICEELLATPGAVDRFYAEIQAASQLSHPNIVNAYDAGPVGQTHFFAMEYLDGIDLERQVRDAGPLWVELACDFIAQAARGLQHAWQRGLLHHDLRPSNLLATRPGVNRSEGDDDTTGSTLRTQGRTLIKLRNLGLSLLRQPSRSYPGVVAEAVPASALSAPDYLSPEQLTNPLATDVRSELYSLGACLFFLITGRPPFGEGIVEEKLARIIHDEPPSIRQFRADVPEAIDTLIRQLLAKDPAQRLQSPAELVEALSAWAEHKPSERTADLALAIQAPPAPAADGAPPSMIVRMARSFTGSLLSLHSSRIKTKRNARARTNRRRLVLLGAAFFALFLMFGGLFVVARWTATSAGNAGANRTNDNAANEELEKLGPPAKDPAEVPGYLRQALALRQKYPGTPAALEAAKRMSEVPCPLAGLDESGIPSAERAPILPKGGVVVGLLGEHNPAQSRPQVIGVLPGSNLAVVRTDNQSAKVYNIITDEVLGTFEISPWTYYFQLSPDGKLFGTIANLPNTPDRAVRIFRLSAPNEAPVVIQKPQMSAQFFAFSPDSQTVVIAGMDRVVRFFDTATGKDKYASPAPTTPAGFGQPIEVLYSPDGSSVAMISHDRWVRVYDASNGQDRWSVHYPGAIPMNAAYSPDSKMLLVMGGDRIGRFYDSSTGKEKEGVQSITLPQVGSPGPNIQVLQPNSGSKQCNFVPNGKAVILVGHDPMNGQLAILIWDIEAGKMRCQAVGPVGLSWNQFYVMGASADGKTFRTWGHDQALRLCDSTSGKEFAVLKAAVDRISVAAVSPTGHTISTGSEDGRIEVWEVDRTSMKVQRTLRGNTMAVSALVYAPDGQSLATGGYDHYLRLWDLSRKESEPVFKTQTPNMVTGLAFAPGGDLLASGSPDGIVSLWDASSGKHRSNLDGLSGWVSALAFSPDGRILAGATEDGSMRLWNITNPRERGECSFGSGAITALAFAPDGKNLFAGVASSPFMRLASGSEALFRPAPGPAALGGSHGKAVRGLAFAPGGKFLASVGDDGQVFLWKVGASWEIAKRYTLPGPARGISIAPDARHFVVTNTNGTCYILRLPEQPQ
jgi:serine/threonine-protein kinase